MIKKFNMCESTKNIEQHNLSEIQRPKFETHIKNAKFAITTVHLAAVQQLLELFNYLKSIIIHYYLVSKKINPIKGK
jgi:hypothetical protein